MNAEQRADVRQAIQVGLERGAGYTEVGQHIAWTEVLDLLDHIDRLEGLLKPLVEEEPGHDGICGYCHSYEHEPACPWLTAEQAMDHFIESADNS